MDLRFSGRGLVALSFILLILGGCSKPFVSIDDTVVMADTRTQLVAFVERHAGLDNFAGVPGVEVGFWVDGGEVARAVTDDDGRAYVLCSLPQSA